MRFPSMLAARLPHAVLDGLVSVQSALEDDGMVLKPQTVDVDEAATQRQRRRMRRQTTMFHQGEYLTAID